jgi:hypothetical protein
MMKKRKFAPGKSTASKPVKKAEGGSVMRGNAPVVKKMALGGMGAGQQRRAAEDPEFARRLANNAAFSKVQAGRRQFAVGTPERQNYEAYKAMEEAKFRSLGSRGAPTGTYTAGAYNPNTAYTTQLAQQRAAADAAKKAAMPVKRAKGGMASKPSAAKKRDGIAVRGKTKGKMR